MGAKKKAKVNINSRMYTHFPSLAKARRMLNKTLGLPLKS